MLRNDKAEDSLDAKVEIVDIVSLLVEVNILRGESGTQLRRTPCQEIPATDLSEQVKLLKVVSMNFFGDFEPQVLR